MSADTEEVRWVKQVLNNFMLVTNGPLTTGDVKEFFRNNVKCSDEAREIVQEWLKNL